MENQNRYMVIIREVSLEDSKTIVGSFSKMVYKEAAVEIKKILDKAPFASRKKPPSLKF